MLFSAGAGAHPLRKSVSAYFPLEEAFSATKEYKLDEGSAVECGWFSTSREVIFREYAPRVFSWIRRDVYKVTSKQYAASMGGAAGGAQASSAKREMISRFSEAKGGGFFFFSADERYIIKTMTYEEHATLLHVLRSYCRYLLTDAGLHSLIMRISGCYSITMYGIKKYFFVMDNLFNPATCPFGTRPSEIYDLKGSWVDRHVASAKQKKSHQGTRKDTDWPSARFLRLSDESKRILLRQAQRDARFLCDLRIMDYSLLLGIHIVEEQRPAAIRERGDRAPHSWAAQSFEGPGSYILGIIDPLQRWTVRKRIERYLKILIHCRCASDLREGMSAIEPVSYARRFHERFGTEQLKLTLAEVRADWEDESAARERERVRKEQLAEAARAPWMYMGT